MKVQANTLRAGHVFEHNGRVWIVARSEINTPGKGAAVIQVEMRDAKTGVKSNERFRTQETVERLRLDEFDMQYLYAEGDVYTFMNPETYEQLSLNKDLIGDPVVYLQDGMTCNVKVLEGKPIGVEIPSSVVLAIVEADPVVRGQTATSSYKPAVLENGVKVMVPPHIETGTRIVVNTADSSYVERAKN
ncbi:MAG: elongation factor P [Alphaproteobacteria bacterium]|nr:MAG: elongation factor P [Alphaproteobacteria bacterium]